MDNKLQPNYSPSLIAHRGFSGSYPENTLLSYQAAYDCGARFMELDIQLTQDKVPILHHDHNLKRLCGVDQNIDTVLAKTLAQYPASYAEKFGAKFADNRLTTLDEFCHWLSSHPDVTVFIELKQEAIDYSGEIELLEALYHIIESHKVGCQCIIISFNHSILFTARQHLSLEIGWVLPSWDATQEAIARHLQPEFMFCKRARLPDNDDDLWPGNWHWAVYNIDDLDSLASFKQRNIDYLETNEIKLLLKAIESTNGD